jgi:hypothetical protein
MRHNPSRLGRLYLVRGVLGQSEINGWGDVACDNNTKEEL